jgi:multisubunit Na+/H+ antiporter MnhG subunit
MSETQTPSEKPQPRKAVTLKHFVVAIIRLQSLWMFFYAAYGATYLPSYFKNVHYATQYTASYTEAKFSLFMELLRIMMHIVAGILIIQYTAPLLNYLLKDSDDEVKSSEQLFSEQSSDSKGESKPL